MCNDLIKIVFFAWGLLLCMTAESTSKISKDLIGEEKKELLASVEEEEELTKGGEKAALTVITLPPNILVRGDLVIPGIENTRRAMPNNGVMEIAPTGAVIRDPDLWGIKMQHPGWSGTQSPKKAKIEIYALIGEGDSARLIAQFDQRFAKIARMIVPYLSSDLIQDDVLPSKNGWKGIFGVIPDDDDGFHMFSPSIAEYYNARRTYTLIWDVANPVLNGNINTAPDPAENNFVFKSIVATLDPTDPALPTYDSGTAPCGVDANGVYHVPFGIGCKDPTTIVKGVVYIPSVDIRGTGKVMLKGDNSYLVEGAVYIRKGVEAIVSAPTSMPQSNINVQPDLDGGASVLTFPANLASETTFAMGNGKTLTVKEGGAVNVPHNATLNLGRANVAVETGATMSIGGKVLF